MLSLTGELAVFINIVVFVKHVFARNTNMIEKKSGIINTIQSKLDTHFSVGNTRQGLMSFHISNRNKKCTNTFILSIHNSLSKYKVPVGMLTCI